MSPKNDLGWYADMRVARDHWAVMLANIACTLTFGAHDATILARGIIALVALPVLLLIQAPAFFGKETHRAALPTEAGLPQSPA